MILCDVTPKVLEKGRIPTCFNDKKMSHLWNYHRLSQEPLAKHWLLSTLILMHFPCWFQIWTWNVTFLKFLKKKHEIETLEMSTPLHIHSPWRGLTVFVKEIQVSWLLLSHIKSKISIWMSWSCFISHQFSLRYIADHFWIMSGSH